MLVNLAACSLVLHTTIDGLELDDAPKSAARSAQTLRRMNVGAVKKGCNEIRDANAGD